MLYSCSHRGMVVEINKFVVGLVETNGTFKSKIAVIMIDESVNRWMVKSYYYQVKVLKRKRGGLAVELVKK